jgi:hypothetical protein
MRGRDGADQKFMRVVDNDVGGGIGGNDAEASRRRPDPKTAAAKVAVRPHTSGAVLYDDEIRDGRIRPVSRRLTDIE